MNDSVLNVVLPSEDGDANKDTVFVLTDEFGHPIYGYPVE